MLPCNGFTIARPVEPTTEIRLTAGPFRKVEDEMLEKLSKAGQTACELGSSMLKLRIDQRSSCAGTVTEGRVAYLDMRAYAAVARTVGRPCICSGD